MKTFKRYYGHNIDNESSLLPFDSTTPGTNPRMAQTFENEKTDILANSDDGDTVDIYEVTFKLIKTVVIIKELVALQRKP